MATKRPLIGGRVRVTRITASGNQSMAWSHNDNCHVNSITVAIAMINPPIIIMTGTTWPSPTSLPVSLRPQFGQASAGVK